MGALWCALLAILCVGSLWREATALITPEQKQAMLCEDTCSLMTQRAGELDPTYTTFVLTSEDLGSDEKLTSLKVRASCVDYSAVEAVFPSNKLDSLEIYADTLDMSKATKLPDSRSITIHANMVIGAADDPDQVVRYAPATLFSVLGYPQILEDDTYGTPGTSSTVTPQPSTRNLTFGDMDISDSISFMTGFEFPELRGVKVVWSDYRGGADTVVGSDNANIYKQITGNTITPNAVAGLLVRSMSCDDPSFVSPNYTASVDLPWYCYRRFPVVSEWAFAVYRFEWDATVPTGTPEAPLDTPSDAVYTIRARRGYPDPFQLHVASEVVPGISSIPTPRFRQPVVYGATEPLTLLIPDLGNTIECYHNFVNYPEYDVANVVELLFLCQSQSRNDLDATWRVVITVSSPSDGVGGSLAPLPLNRPDTDVSRLLLFCWSSNFDLPPYNSTFENSLNTLINFFTVPGGSTPEGALWAEATKLYKRVNTNYPSRQLVYPKLSYELYTETLVSYANYYSALSIEVQKASIYGSLASERLASANNAVEQAASAEVTAGANWQQLLSVKDEISVALTASLATYQATASTIQPALVRFQAGLAQEEAIEIFQEITGIIENIVAVSAYVVKEDYFQAARYAFQGLSEAIKGGFEIGDLYKLSQEMANFVATVEAFQILGTNRGDGEELLALLQADISLEDPDVFPDDVKQRLTLSTFQYNLGDIVNQELQLEAIRDQSQSDLADVIAKGVDGASELSDALIQTAINGLEALKLSIQYDEALNQAIVAGVQYLTARLTLRQTQSLVADISNDQQRINELNFALFLQTYSVKIQLLRLLQQACNAFFYAAVAPCGLAEDVLNGANEANLVSIIEQLQLKFEDAVSDRSRPQTVKVELAYDNSSAEIQALRNNNTFTITVPLSSFNFSRFYAIGLDNITLTFDNIRVTPPNAEVKVGIANAGSSENRDKDRKSFSFRGPVIVEDYVYAPGQNNRIITPGAIYPGDVYAYFKPSPFTTWQFNISRKPVDSATGSVDVSQITGAYVTFQGRGFVYTASGQFVAAGCRPQSVVRITDDYCTAIVSNDSRAECNHLWRKIAKDSSKVCAKDDLCGVSLLKRS